MSSETAQEAEERSPLLPVVSSKRRPSTTTTATAPSPTPSRAPSYGTSASPAPPHHRRKRRQAPPRKLRSKLLFVVVSVLLGVCVYASFVDDFMGDVESAITCGTCLGVLVPLQALAHVGDDAFVDFFVGFCTNLGIEDADVCAGAIGDQAPILAHDLRSISLASHAAKHFCSTVFGMCPLQPAIPYSVVFETEAPPPLLSSAGAPLLDDAGKKVKKWRSKGREPLKVVHLSDVHIDRSYVVGSNAICSKEICCRDYGLGSLGPNISHPAGKFGNEHCDSPVDLVDSMLRAIEEHVPNKDFTIFTGDIVEAAVWDLHQPVVEDDMRKWYADMNRTAPPPSYPALGNQLGHFHLRPASLVLTLLRNLIHHPSSDVSPVNSFPRSTSPSAPSSQWVFDLAANEWEKWIGEESAQMVREKSGCYSKVHGGDAQGKGGLRIISLNTLYWYKQNFWLYDSDEPHWDPNGILSWMASELHEAERLGQRAWIIGHMSFGKTDAFRDQSNYANQIFERYHETIAAQFYGHSHADEFEIAYEDYGNRTVENAHGIAYLAGALTPQSGNPVFRVYDIDPDTYEVMDFTPYYTNRSEPSFETEPIWKPYYSARESYGGLLNPPIGPLDSLDAPFWHRVTEAFERDVNAFRMYQSRKSRGARLRPCGSACRNATICGLRSMRSESNCVHPQIGFSFKDKKPEPDEPGSWEDPDLPDDGEEMWLEQHVHDVAFPACEGPGLGSMLRKLGRAANEQDSQPFTQFHQADRSKKQRENAQQPIKARNSPGRRERNARAYCLAAVAAPADRRAQSWAGQSTYDTYMSTASINTAVFPDEAQVGYQQATPTGIEAAAAETAPAFPSHVNINPLVVPLPYQTGTTLKSNTDFTKDTYGGTAKGSTPLASVASGFLSARYWGNLSPQYSVDSSYYGLPGAGPAIPEQCSLTQVHYYYRHGARYPTSGSAPGTFAQKIANLTGNFNATGPLTFLNSWKYQLGAELLTPFGRQQNFDLGVSARQAYGFLLNNFTEQGTYPVFRTQSQDRMVKTALNFMAGFFGVPEYSTSAALEIEVEALGYNASGAPYEACPNANKAYGSVGTTAATNYTNTAYLSAVERLQSFVTGFNVTTTDVGAMLQLCAYETDALGYSKFCEIFTEEDFQAFERSFDISFYGNNGFGSPVGAAQGLAYLQEFYSRREAFFSARGGGLKHLFSQTVLTNPGSAANGTLDGSNVTFPLNQSIYADAAHEVSILDGLTALNLTALAKSGAPSAIGNHTFIASQVVPFATNLVVQVMECQPSVPTKQIRFIVNDAVIPLEDSYEGCEYDYNGLCAFDTVLAALAKRIDEIDFNYDCFANYTVPAYGEVTNGRAPKA
ncbi:hypothetical protein MNV49_004654 [Pseudohyphozyma bogoriensis]|nr:hypothetical protein MNV49_004654 [Pseudohyphozyma bogoriensis]